MEQQVEKFKSVFLEGSHLNDFWFYSHLNRLKKVGIEVKLIAFPENAENKESILIVLKDSS